MENREINRKTWFKNVKNNKIDWQEKIGKVYGKKHR